MCGNAVDGQNAIDANPNKTERNAITLQIVRLCGSCLYQLRQKDAAHELMLQEISPGLLPGVGGGTVPSLVSDKHVDGILLV